mgnify:CR=1 FL=1
MIKLFFIFLFCFVFFISDAAAFQFNVDPPKLILNVKPGEKKSGYIRITNTSAKGATHIKAYSLDLIYLPDGSNDFVPLGSTPWSIGSWLKINPDEFDIPPGGEKTVRVQVDVPPEAKGGYYGVVFFENYSPYSAKKNQSTLTIGVRIGTIILVESADTAVYEARFDAVSVVKKDNNYQLQCAVQNLGNILIRPFGTAQISDDKNNVVQTNKINPNKEGIFPRTTRKLSMNCSGPLKEGRYLARVLLDYGADTLLGGQTSFNATANE